MPIPVFDLISRACTAPPKCLALALAMCVGTVLEAAAPSASPERPPAKTGERSSATARTETAAQPVERGPAMQLVAGKSVLLPQSNALTRVSVGSPEVADVVLIHPHEVYVLGKKTGQTNLMLWRQGQPTRMHDLSVGADTVTLKSRMQEWIAGIEDLQVDALGDHLVLRGRAEDAVKAHRLAEMAQAFAGEKKVINLMRVGSAQQVMLEVKVAEVSKNLLDELSVDVNIARLSGDTALRLITRLSSSGTTGPGSTLTAARVNGRTSVGLSAEVQKNLVKVLAEPTITAIHGQEGSFLAGGRIYMPVNQSTSSGGTVVRLEEKEFGVGLRFLPTVLEDGLINLKVTPEVSELSPNGTTIRDASGMTTLLPAITTRRASTTVQLRDGETFVIGGLIKNNVTEAIKAFPVLGELPIIGALFRSTSFQNEKSELLFVVTPRLASPQSGRAALPTDGFIPPTRNELFLEGRLEGRPASGAAGDAADPGPQATGQPATAPPPIRQP